LQRQQARLLDLQRDSAMRSCVTVCWAIVLPKAVRAGALAHQLERALGRADRAHAVVDAAGAEAALGDLEAAAFAEQDVAAGTRTFFSSISMWPCGASS
jgi:hypothetical protein